jgi:hypothetical protein
VSPAFEVRLEREDFTPGEEVKGSVVVTSGGGARRLEVALEFHERSPDYEEVPVRLESVLHEGDLTAGSSFDFSIALPQDALPGYRSRHGELWWELAVKCDEPFGRDERVRRRIEVAA